MKFQPLSTIIEQRLVNECTIDPLEAGSFVLQRGELINQIIVALSGTAIVTAPDQVPVVVTAPFVLDRSVQDGQGRSTVAAMASSELGVARLSQQGFARLLGAVPDLRRTQREQRDALFSQRPAA